MAFFIAVIIMALIYGFTVTYYKNHWKDGLTVDIKFDHKGVDAGTLCSLTETVENHKRMPLPVVSVDIEADSSFEFEDEEYDGSRIGISDKYYRKDIYTLKSLRRVKRTLMFRPMKRGYYKSGNPHVVTRDFFMAHKYACVFDCETSMFVYPAKTDVSAAEEVFRKISGEFTARKTFEEDPFAFRGIRDYMPGDPVRHINWKASAKTGNTLVNMFDSSFSQEVCIILDGSTRYISEKSQVLEKCISAASSVALLILKRGARVSLKSGIRDMLSGKYPDLPGGVNLQQEGIIDRTLACLDTEAEVQNIEKYLDEIRESGDKRIMCFIITSSFSGELSGKINELKEKKFDVGGFLVHPDGAVMPLRKETLPDGFCVI